MADDSRDVLMSLEMKSGEKFEAECTAVIPPNRADALTDGFVGTGMVGNLVRGNYFSIEDFTFDAGAISDQPSGMTNPAQVQDAQTRAYDADNRRETNRAIGALHDRHHVLEQRVVELEDHIAALHAERDGRRSGGRSGRSGGRTRQRAALAPPNVSTSTGAGDSIPFQRFMLQGRAALRGDGRYPSDLEPVAITRRMDISSRVLFDKCATSYVFKSACIIKRKAIGADTLRTYLRLDFYDVMLIDLAWNDDDVIKETFKFVCRRAKIQYALETPSTDPGKDKSTSVLTVQKPPVEWAPTAKK